MDLNQFVRDVPNFPKAGVTFKDITPLLQNPKALQTATDELFEMVNGGLIDKVVGVGSRGFIFAPALAMRLGAGFIPVRKAGKLPYDKLATSYELEYGQDTLEIHNDAIRTGERVLVHDDVLATGGTAKAVCSLVEELGGVIVQCNFLVHLTFLNGAGQLTNYPINSLLKY